VAIRTLGPTKMAAEFFSDPDHHNLNAIDPNPGDRDSLLGRSHRHWADQSIGLSAPTTLPIASHSSVVFRALSRARSAD